MYIITIELTLSYYCFNSFDGDHRELHVRTHSFPTRLSSELDEMEFYTFGNYSWSRGTPAFFYRNPNASFISTSIPLTNTPGGQRFSFRQLFPGAIGRAHF